MSKADAEVCRLAAQISRYERAGKVAPKYLIQKFNSKNRDVVSRRRYESERHVNAQIGIR